MKKKITAVFADIDGTLVERGCAMNQITTDALNRLHAQGVKIGIASGRPVDWRMKKNAQTWNLDFEFDMMMGMNGGQLWDCDHEGMEQVYMLDEETTEAAYRIMEPLHKNAFIYVDDDIACNQMDKLMELCRDRNQIFIRVIGYEHPEALWAQPVNKLLYRIPADEMPAVLEYLDKQPKDPRFNYFLTGPEVLEFQDPRVNKGTGLRRYAERNNIPVEEIAAFGDMENDTDMIREAGLGICMCNGCDASKKAADCITEYSAAEGGVGRWIFDHILNDQEGN